MLARWIAIVLAGCTLLAVPAVALAQDEEPTAAQLERAKQLYANGRDLYGDGLYEEAVTAWREGYRLSRRPPFLHNMGMAYEQLGFLEEAVDTFNRYRAFARAGEIEDLKARIASLNGRLAAIERGEGDPGAEGMDRPLPGIEMLDDEPLDIEPIGPAPPPSKLPGDPLPTVPLVMTGAGVVAVVTGLAIGGSASGARRGALLSCSDVSGELLCLEAARGDLARGRALGVAADAVGIGGLALLGVGSMALVRGPGPAEVAVHARGVEVQCAF